MAWSDKVKNYQYGRKCCKQSGNLTGMPSHKHQATISNTVTSIKNQAARSMRKSNYSISTWNLTHIVFPHDIPRYLLLPYVHLTALLPPYGTLTHTPNRSHSCSVVCIEREIIRSCAWLICHFRCSQAQMDWESEPSSMWVQYLQPTDL